MKLSYVLEVLKNYESKNSPFYETEFEDYLIDINLEEYDGMSLSKMSNEEDIINDYINWKTLNE